MIKMKAVLVSEDKGQTWYVNRVFYFSTSEGPGVKSKFLNSKEYEKMVLKTIN